MQLPGARGGRVRLCGAAPIRTVPVIGRVAAGVPRLAHEDIEGFLPVPAAWTPSGRFFALRVTGDSMTGAGILDGDHVIVRCQVVAKSGEIVVVTIDGETTLKRLLLQRGQALLLPENPAYETIEIKTESTLIHGVVVGLLRPFRRDHACIAPPNLAD